MNHNHLTDYLKVQNKLRLIKQSHLLELFPSLLPEEQETLIQSILNIDIKRFKEQTHFLTQPKNHFESFEPYEELLAIGDAKKIQRGRKACEQGQCAALLIAGGQGTRLGHPGPKGTFPISPIYQKSLFQLFCEKVLIASKKAKKALPFVIMTSPLNDSLTRRYLKEHSYFGLEENQVLFFTQTMLPLLSFEGKMFLNEKSTLALGPDGNGSCYKNLKTSKTFKKLEDLGIKYLNILPVDNPLAEPFDEELFGELILSEADVTLKTCQRLSSQEKVGVVVKKDNKPIVIEYHEIDPSYTFKKEPAANLSLLAMTLDFAKKCASKDLPLHKAAKAYSFFDLETQKIHLPKKPNCWKFETYLFDILPYSEKTSVLTYQRRHIFCPLKNKEGEFSPQSVRQSLAKIGIE